MIMYLRTSSPLPSILSFISISLMHCYLCAVNGLISFKSISVNPLNAVLDSHPSSWLFKRGVLRSIALQRECVFICEIMTSSQARLSMH